MRALASVLLLVVPALATPAESGAGAVVPDAAPAAAAADAAAAAPSAAAAAPEAKAPAPVVPIQAVVEKLGYGDRLFLAGEYRNALFAYQDAVYMQPRYAPARVKLGRAYLALRYAPQAIVQAEAALAADPESAEARKLLDDASSSPPRFVAPPASQQPAAAAVPAPRPGPRVFRLTPQPDAAPAPAVAPAASGGR
jgi:tetratricopeptide (TPR) repeat protein